MAIAAALSGAVPTYADAAGLGRLTVQSALGQPLRAEVEITSLGREEAGTLSARLAPADAFRQAGLDFNPALSSLRFAVEQRPGGNPIVRITSAQPVNEPFVDLLVELNWSAGKFVREYTFLLDPPELRIGRETVVAGGQSTQAAAPIVAPAVAAQTSRAPAATTQASAAPAARAAAPAPAARSEGAVAPRAAAPASAAPAGSAPGSVQVRSGDTLASIAARVKPADVAIEQAVMAIYAANPQAFFGTVHQMYAGATLTIPDRAAMTAIDATTAQREIRAQARDFNAYRARLASAARDVAPATAGQTAAGTVGAKVEPAAPATTGDQLKLSRSAGTAASPDTATGSTTGAAGAEADIARESALREQQQRVSALERNVADLQQLVELKNRQLAELQQQVEAARLAGTTASGSIGAAGVAAGAAAADAGAAGTATAPATTPPATTTAAATTPGVTTAETSAPAAGQPAVDSTAAPSTDAAPGATPTAGSAATDTAAASGTDTTASTTTGAASEPAASTAQAPAPTASTQPAPVEEPSALAALMDNPLLLPAFAAIALGLGAYGLYAVRRRKKAEEFDDSLSAADAFTANSLFGSTGGQAVDTHNSLFETSSRDSGVDVHSTEVDPIAEAEVYIAYGREAQAEEILKEALKKQPERQAIRLKLLEIQAARKDPIAFGALAQEMYDMAGGQNEEWPKVVTLGLSIDPANPLYTGQGDASASAFADAAQDDDGRDGYDAGSPAAGLSAAAGAAAAVFGEKLDDGQDDAARRARGIGPFAETVPMDGENVADAGVPALDFDLDLETTVGRAGKVRAEQIDEAGAGAESELERALEGRFDLPSLDLDLTAAGRTPDRSNAEIASSALDDSVAEEPPALSDLGEFKIDLPSLEGLDTRPALHEDDEPAAIDFGDFDVGSDGSHHGDLASGDLGLAAAETAVEPTVDASRWQEMATKLDLASAYEEIGDKEGARELLEEVLDGGDTAQQQKARVMLSKIG